MHLKTVCPRCANAYQVDPSLRGKYMRCPNLTCRFIFEVREEGAAAPAPPPPTAAPPPPPPLSRRSGSVGDMVPILQAETAEAVTAPPAPPRPAPPAAPQKALEAVPILPAEPAHAAEAVPILPAEPARPMAAVPILPAEVAGPVEPPPSAAVASLLTPPPVRGRGNPPAPAPPVEPPRAPELVKPPAPKRPRVKAPPTPPAPAPVQVPAPPPVEKPAHAPAAPAPAAEQPLDDDAMELLRELGLAAGAPSTPAAEAPAAEALPVEVGPIEYAAGAAPPPPVRRGDADTALMEAPAFPAPPPPDRAPADEASRRRRRRPLIAVAALLALVGGVTWAGFRLAGGQAAGNEDERHKKALKEYAERNFGDAAEQFRALARDFPASPNKPAYDFFAELSDVREPIYTTQTDVEQTRGSLKRLAEFTIFAKDDPLLKEHHADLYDGFRRLGEELAEVTKQKLDRVLLRETRFAFTEATKYKPAGAPARDMTADLAAIEKQIAAKELHQRTVAYVKASLKDASAEVVQQVRTAVADAGLTGDAEVKGLLDKLPQAHLASVKYTPVPPDVGRAPTADAEDREPSLLVVPLLEGPKGATRSDRPPVLAVARGVLYALEPRDGEVRWAVRVGADAARQPLWLPRTDVAPESVLVLSSDGTVLSALDAASGATRWRRALAGACLGRPVLVDGRVFVPTYTGRVEEIEVNGGALLGYYDLGQPLTVGGARQPGTHLVWFPADSFCVYGLDVGRRTCAAVLYTAHPGGSLRGPPLVLVGAGKQGGQLVLSQADGLEAMRLRTFALPVTGTDPVALQPEPRLDGWSWFPPWSDGERLIQITDAGEFALWGIEPRPDRSPFFPVFKERIAPGAAGRLHAGRAQLALADGGQFWVLAHGGLYRLRSAFTRAAGPRLEPPGPPLLDVGSPLHPAQVQADEQGEAVLFLTTQSAGGESCQVTAVGTRLAEVRWRRQLGLVCRGQPLAVLGGAPLRGGAQALRGGGVLARDLSGELFLFDAEKVADAPGRLWRLAGRPLPGRGGAADGSFHLLAGANGKVYTVAVSRRGAGSVLTLGEVAGGKASQPPREFPLPAPLAGTPAVVGDGVILPLANGVLLRQPLAGGAASTGPNWRAAQADPQAKGHVVALGGEDFLVTDGSRGVRRMSTDGKTWEAKASAESAQRIVSAPVVLGTGAELRVCVADTDHAVTLLRGDDLREARRWTMSGRITAGPFVRGGGIGCVLDKRRLVWLDPKQPVDPKQPESRWWVAFPADVVGQPELVDGVLVVADQRGQFRALDPATGERAGVGYTLKVDVAPTAAPIPFGQHHLFVPLTDGTVLLLSRQYLRHPLRDFPTLR